MLQAVVWTILVRVILKGLTDLLTALSKLIREIRLLIHERHLSHRR